MKLLTAKIASRWPGPAVILHINGAGATVKFRGYTCKVARYRVRRRADAKDVGAADWSPAAENLDALDVMPPAAPGKSPGDDRSFL